MTATFATPSAAPSPFRQMALRTQQSRSASALVAALLLTTSATAQIIPTGTPPADILLSQAIAEQRAFLTCTTLDTANHQSALTFWQGDVAAAVAILTANNVPPPAITAFKDAASAGNLLPAEDTPFAAVKAYCDAQGAWFTRWSRRDFTNLRRSLPGAFK